MFMLALVTGRVNPLFVFSGNFPRDSAVSLLILLIFLSKNQLSFPDIKDVARPGSVH